MARSKKRISRPQPNAEGLENDFSGELEVPEFYEKSDIGHSNESVDFDHDVQSVHASEHGSVPTQASEPTSQEADGNASVSTKPGVKRSIVWDHFNVYEKKSVGVDADGNECEVIQKRAYCIHCPRGKIGDYSIDTDGNSTSESRILKAIYLADVRARRFLSKFQTQKECPRVLQQMFE
ncbi:hypothetical protein OROGR_024004 [Orobanche gracilis]